MWHFRHRYMSLHSRRHKWQVALSNPFMLLAHLSCPSCPNKVTTLRLYQIPHLSWFSWKMNKLRWYPQQSQRFIFCKSFWSVLRGQALEPSPEPVEPDLAFPEPVEPDLALHQGFLEPSLEPSPEPCWTWPGSAPKSPRPSPEPSPEPCWTRPSSAPKPPRPSP